MVFGTSNSELRDVPFSHVPQVSLFAFVAHHSAMTQAAVPMLRSLGLFPPSVC